MIGLVVLELALQDARALEHVLVIVEREILELQIVASGRGGHETGTAPAADAARSWPATP
jgi:hypothetical protein